MRKSGNWWTLGGAVTAAVAASLCCLGPLLSLGLGLGSFTAAAFFAQWRPALLLLTLFLLGAGWFLAIRRRNTSCSEGPCVRRSRRPSFVALSIGTLIAVASAAIPWVASIDAGTADRVALASGGESFAVSIPTMDCAACAKGIEASLRRAPGILNARVDYGAKRAEFTFDPTKTTRETVLARIDETGFAADRATLKRLLNRSHDD